MTDVPNETELPKSNKRYFEVPVPDNFYPYESFLDCLDNQYYVVSGYEKRYVDKIPEFSN